MPASILLPQIPAKERYKSEQSKARAISGISKRVRLSHLSTRDRIALAVVAAVIVVPWWMGVVEIARFAAHVMGGH